MCHRAVAWIFNVINVCAMPIGLRGLSSVTQEEQVISCGVDKGSQVEAVCLDSLESHILVVG